MAPIAFSVSYRLGEYLAFVRDHSLVVLNEARVERGKAPIGKTPWYAVAPMVVFAAVVFIFKKRRMPVCDFVIDDWGITRSTADGKFAMAWSDVVAVHRYSRGYLVVKRNGAVPLPFRCLSPAEVSTPDSYVGAPAR